MAARVRLSRAAIALIALASGAGLALAAAAPAFAINTDPRCDDIGIPVETSPAVFDGLPAMIPTGDADCVVTFNGRPYLYYLTDPFGRFLATIATFGPDWQATEVLDNGSRVPADLDALSSRENDKQIDIGLLASSGAYVEFFYNTDLDGGTDYFSDLTGDVLVIAYTAPRTAPTGFADPGILSELRSVAEAVPNPAQTAVLVVGATLITALVGFPGILLGAVLSARLDGWMRWGRTLTARLPRVGRPRIPKPVAIALTVVAAAVVTGFIDPAFGFNGLSVRMVLTQVAAFTVFNVGGWLVLRAVHRRLGLAAPALVVRPISLIAIAALVLLSRLLLIEPGIVFGLITAIVFASALAAAHEARVILVGAAFAAAVGIVSWILFSLTPAGIVGVQEFFSGLTLEGVSTLPLVLLPLARLDGAKLFRWRRAVWAVAYAVGVAIFMLIVLHLPGASAAVPADFVRWVVLFVAFAVVAVAIWVVDRRLTKKSA